MTDTGAYRYIPGVSEVGDIDLDETVIHDQSGNRVTEADVEAEYQEAKRARSNNLLPGGKSLSGGTTHSPRLHLVVPADSERRIKEEAKRADMSVSRWLRRTMEEKLAA